MIFEDISLIQTGWYVLDNPHLTAELKSNKADPPCLFCRAIEKCDGPKEFCGCLAQRFHLCPAVRDALRILPFPTRAQAGASRQKAMASRLRGRNLNCSDRRTP